MPHPAPGVDQNGTKVWLSADRKPSAESDGTYASPSTLSLGNLLRRPEAGALVGTIGVFVFFSFFGGHFLSAGGVASWLNVAAELGIVAMPVGVLMIAGELDLSVGSVLAASSLTLATCPATRGAPSSSALPWHLPWVSLVGFVNGLLVTRTRFRPSL